MQMPGLITITPGQTDLIEEVAAFMGESFLEEFWTATYLEALDPLALDPEAAAARKLAVSREMMRAELAHGAAHAYAYALPDRAGALLGFLGSELAAQDTTWERIEEEARAELAESLLAPAEAAALSARGEAMKPISHFGWGAEEAAEFGFDDYLYFAAWAVAPDKRGSGAFRRLVSPPLRFAERRGIPCFLECYADHLISLYEHIGFEAFRVLSDPAFPIKQTCMVRLPR